MNISYFFIFFNEKSKRIESIILTMWNFALFSFQSSISDFRFSIPFFIPYIYSIIFNINSFVYV